MQLFTRASMLKSHCALERPCNPHVIVFHVSAGALRKQLCCVTFGKRQSMWIIIPRVRTSNPYLLKSSWYTSLHAHNLRPQNPTRSCSSYMDAHTRLSHWCSTDALHSHWRSTDALHSHWCRMTESNALISTKNTALATQSRCRF